MKLLKIQNSTNKGKGNSLKGKTPNATTSHKSIQHR